jgi:hypothetical protein
MHQCFALIPGCHYGIPTKVFNAVINPPDVGFPLLPLPYYVGGMTSVVFNHGTKDNNFNSQIEFLIDGMDIDEGWCCKYIDSPEQKVIRERCTPSAKQARMGSHPKYEGNLTTFIRNESERQVILGVVGRNP